MNISYETKKTVMLTMLVGATMLLLPDTVLAAAAANTDFGGVGSKLCQVVQAITGNIGRAIATIAIVFLGIGAFFGKVTWGLAVAVGIGIFAIFGAASIVGRFAGSGSGCTINAAN